MKSNLLQHQCSIEVFLLLVALQYIIKILQPLRLFGFVNFVDYVDTG